MQHLACIGRLSAFGLALFLSATANAQVIVVDTASDVTDFTGVQQVADLPGPDGKVSLAEAGLASDHTPGVQTIAFRIPQSEWQYQWLYPGRVVLRPFLGFRVFDTVILDATTQTAFTGDTNPAGGEVVIWESFYVLNGVGSVVRGFDSTAISVSGGASNVVQGNTLGNIEVYDSPSTLIGGVNPGEGNTPNVIKLDRTNDCVVIGNTTTRVRVLGWFGGGQPATNNRIGGPTDAERNHITGYGTWSEGCPGGTTVQVFDTIGTIVENNWIGTTPDGMSQGSLASTTGIGFESENHGAVIANNRIAGILGHGTGPHCTGWLVGNAISIYGIGSNVTITGNTIGLNALDQPLLGSVTGIETSNYYLGTLQNVVIGGTAPGAGNVIAGNLLSGVKVSNTYLGVQISGNAIYDNGAIGIDLVDAGFATGVTANDALDADTGGNGLQNFPVIQAAVVNGGQVRIVGTLASEPSTAYGLEFFASSQCDASGNGEGEHFLGVGTVTTDAGGHAAFDVTLAAGVPLGWNVTATATNAATGSTSEFSTCFTAAGAPVVAYCTSKTNSLGCVPQIGAQGTPSLSDASPFLVTGAQVLNNVAGMFVYSTSGRAVIPFQGGTLCFNPQFKRTPLIQSNGAPLPTLDCSGLYVFDFDAWYATGIDPALVPGAVVEGQFWSRDAASLGGIGLTNAIEFVVTP